MLGNLIRKEILDQIVSARFLILSAIGALVIWLSLFSGCIYYQARLEDYRLAQAAARERVRQLMAADELDPFNPWRELRRPQLITRPPTAMSIFVRGLDPGLGRSLPAFGIREGAKLSPAAVEPRLGYFPPLDLGFTVRVVLSLFVLLFTFDAVCGEKEAGRLSLISSFPVPKDRLLLGKLIGALVPTLAAYGIPLLLGLAVVLMLPDVALTGTELLRLFCMFAAFAVYLAAFICVGLFASSVTHRTATSFVLLLSFWAIGVIIVPRVSLIAAEGIRPAPSVQEYQAEKTLVAKLRLEKHRELRGKWEEGRTRPGEEYWRTPEGREAFYVYYDSARVIADRHVEPRQKRLDEAFHNRYEARASLAVSLARFSPAFALRNAVLLLTGTGLGRQQRFDADYDRYFERRRAWYRQASILFFLRRMHPAKYGEPRWDIADMVRFTYRERWPPGDFIVILYDLGAIVLWGLAGFAGAYIAVRRYDPR